MKPREERYEKAFARFIKALEWYTKALGVAIDPEKS